MSQEYILSYDNLPIMPRAFWKEKEFYLFDTASRVDAAMGNGVGRYISLISHYLDVHLNLYPPRYRPNQSDRTRRRLENDAKWEAFTELALRVDIWRGLNASRIPFPEELLAIPTLAAGATDFPSFPHSLTFPPQPAPEPSWTGDLPIVDAAHFEDAHLGLLNDVGAVGDVDAFDLDLALQQLGPDFCRDAFTLDTLTNPAPPPNRTPVVAPRPTHLVNFDNFYDHALASFDFSQFEMDVDTPPLDAERQYSSFQPPVPSNPGGLAALSTLSLPLPFQPLQGTNSMSTSFPEDSFSFEHIANLFSIENAVDASSAYLDVVNTTQTETAGWYPTSVYPDNTLPTPGFVQPGTTIADPNVSSSIQPGTTIADPNVSSSIQPGTTTTGPNVSSSIDTQQPLDSAQVGAAGGPCTCSICKREQSNGTAD
ncbi:hypothetical protein NMY22_g3013 [Coprinellus aureogranulatus]|nr:hypothetical protein NMY22_g3013 [Coprinellus aureogranulatus]